ncbi:hypothetical protein A8709_09320 [Paenibacillus pectinilyticus]|uniref:Uncharacterized protein n=1 Tax=Paenibacillus pectinilyticus TaxID=512399 RepID=A0A1C1A5K6_9BACL|nr:hypothetical protein [Paenibacillus pectinilyticus]OCT15819.1 hypothetical protein A8709_09320 [Paenibacillus pectinilyticus]
MRISASEVIRKTALIILASHPNGLRFTDLKFKTEETLVDTFPPDDYKNGKFRSAIWDLDKRYSELLLKEKRGALSFFTPKPKLIEEKDQIEIPLFAPTSREKHVENQREGRSDKYVDYVEFKAKLTEIIAYIESKKITDVNVDYFTKAEQRNAIKAMIYLEGLMDLKYSMQYVQREEEFRY